MGTSGGIRPYPLKAAGLRSLTPLFWRGGSGGEAKTKGGWSRLGKHTVISFITFTSWATKGRPSENKAKT